jgi:hypothetical protein
VGEIRPVVPVKYFCGILYSKEIEDLEVLACLEKHWGVISLVSDIFPFEWTSYYTKEMGVGLQRRFVGFKELAFPECLVEFKLLTNALEKGFKSSQIRALNLDPGYVDLGKMILGTTKDHAHRLYLGRGIFGEVTLYWKQKRWWSWPWTYPDYLQESYHVFFTKLREQYYDELRGLKNDKRERETGLSLPFENDGKKG